MDIVSSDVRSRMMGNVKSRNTKPELILRKGLHKEGFRYKLHQDNLPGKPDIVLPKYKTAIFVNGCFWHQHKNCKKATLPKTRAEWWSEKLKKNKARDERMYSELIKLGWKVIVVWECQILKSPEKAISETSRLLVVEPYS